MLNSDSIKEQGITRIEDLINSLPQAFASQNSSVSNGSSGIADINLRDLGPERTLVLINGRRLAPGDPSTPFPDVNFIPSALVKRVDVLTGGASSVYGSDAVAGVVNFIIDTDFTGIGADAQYGFYQHNNSDSYMQSINNGLAPNGNSVNGGTFDATLKIGGGFDDNRGHIVAYFGYRSIAAVAESSRDYSYCGLASQTAANGGGFLCSGSSTAFPPTFTLGDGTRFHLDANGNMISGASIFNANPYNYYQRPDTRYTAGFFAHYDLSKAVKPYIEFGFMQDRTNAVIAPSGDFSNTSSINCDNPYLTALPGATQTAICPDGPTGTSTLFIGRRNVEGGGRDADLTHTAFRVVLGTKGDLGKGISYDAYFQYGSTRLDEIYRNEFSVSRLTNALDVVTDPKTGLPVCANGDPACTPVNFFSTTPLDAAQLNYLQVPGFQSGTTTETVANASVTFLGDAYGIKSPWANEGIGLNVGVEYRRETLNLEVDNEFATGDLAGQGGATLPLGGSFNVTELFAELQVPLVSDKPFFHQLTLNGGARFSDYSTAGTVWSYKGQLSWSPIRDITFRGGYNRAVRAPNVQELYMAQGVNLDGTIGYDPCAGDTPAFSQAQCANLGVTAAQYGHVIDNSAAQYNGLQGGNPDLKPEKADTWTLGVVLQPSALRGFSVSVDAFSIKVKDTISVLGGQTIMQQCGLTGDPAFCDLVHRDSQGTIWLTPQGYVVDTYLNIGTLTTRGIDTNLSYKLRTAKAGTFSFTFVGTYLGKLQTDTGPSNYDCAGYYGATCGVPAPKWRHMARLSWNSPGNIGVSLNWRFFGKTHLDASSTQVDLAGPYNPADATVGAQSYFDLVFTSHFDNNLDLRLGVNNIADKEPPLLSSSAAPIPIGNGNTYPQIYDALGRYFFIGASIKY